MVYVVRVSVVVIGSRWWTDATGLSWFGLRGWEVH